MNVKIYVAFYKRDKFFKAIKDPIYIPILCGKKTYIDTSPEDGYLPELGDDTGDNISNKNAYYSELTGLYWIWKNDTSEPDDIVGLNHYRRYFAEPAIKLEDENILLSKETIIKMLKDYDYIIYGMPAERNETTYRKNYFYDAYLYGSAYDNYYNCHIIEDLDNALKCIKKLFPNLYDMINYEVRYEGNMCLCNQIIARKKHFDEYCNFLFTVFKELEYYIDYDDQEHQGYNQRVFGFLAERLFRPWIVSSGHNAIQGRGLDWEKYSGYKWI